MVKATNSKKSRKVKSRIDDWLTPEGLETLKHWARNGLTNDDIAHNMGISRDTLYRWKKAKSDIYDALKEGRIPADAKVESALHRRATGYATVEHQYKMVDIDRSVLWARRNKLKNQYKLDHPEATEEEIKQFAYEKVPTRERIEIGQVEKIVPPDTTAAIFWLKNRDPEHWRERKEIGVDGSIKTSSNLDKLSDEDLRKLTKLADDDQ